MANRHYSWRINPRTRDYEIENGDPVRDESLLFPAYARLRIERGKWLYAPAADYGANFGAVRKRTANAPKQLIAIAEQALQPLIDESRADTIEVESTGSDRNRENLSVDITSVDEEQSTFTFDPLEI